MKLDKNPYKEMYAEAEYGTAAYDQAWRLYWMWENKQICLESVLKITNMIRKYDRNPTDDNLWSVANNIAMYGFGDRSKGVVYENRVLEIERNSCETDEYVYHEISTAKILHHVIVRVFRRYREASLRILDVLERSNIMSREFFGGEDEMKDWIRFIRREMQVPA